MGKKTPWASRGASQVDGGVDVEQQVHVYIANRSEEGSLSTTKVQAGETRTEDAETTWKTLTMMGAKKKHLPSHPGRLVPAAWQPCS